TEHFIGEVPPLEIPEGTQLVVSGRATRALASAALVGAGESGASFASSGDRFEGSFIPGISGVYLWQLRDENGAEAAVSPSPLEITVVRDGAPHIEITFPATDTVLDPSLRQAVVADARDDFGLASA